MELILQILLWGYLAIAVLYWLFQGVQSIRSMRGAPYLMHQPDSMNRDWPKVSAIIPACDEIKAIDGALRSRLRDQYPNLELICVDDRSVDGTGLVMDRIAEQDARVKVVHNRELPAGWLGKLHALHLGTKHASGDWLLFSDGDVHLEPTALKRAIVYAETNGFDHVAVLPQFWPANFILDILMACFIRTFAVTGRMHEVSNPRSKASVGSGSFNLVRRSALGKTGGFEWLKMEPADDVALGKMLKDSGARSTILNGRDGVAVLFYRSVRDAVIGAERASFTVIGDYTMWPHLGLALLVCLLELSPLVWLTQSLWFGLLLLAYAGGLTSYLDYRLTRRILPGLFFPLGSFLSAIFLARAGIVGQLRGGIYWRGTFHPIEELRAGRRLRLL